LKHIDFIEKMRELKIFHAQYNEIETISALPPLIEEMILSGNNLTSLQGL
jgi:Leucine-rich repeat (LRR) protein